MAGLRPALLSALLVATALAGCTGPAVEPTPADPAPDATLATLPGFGTLPLADIPRFSPPLLVDPVRAGGEPVIAVTPKGTLLVSAHPGFTHYHPSDPTHVPTEIAQAYGGQVYLWRSTDGGATWAPVGLPGMELGPRSIGLGVSDPDFTVMADGTVCYTDLEALAAASTSCSLDDGLTWMTPTNPGNPLASGHPVDRQWLASYGNELYFTGNFFREGAANFRVSTDKGVTWQDRGETVCSGDVVANPANGHLYQSCNGIALSVSTDGGATWTAPLGPEGASDGGSRIMNEPALDAGGNVWIAWTDGERTLHLAGTPDEGATWPWVLDLTPHFALASVELQRCAGRGTCDAAADGGAEPEPTEGAYVWPWVSAGSEGRVAVTWIGAFSTEPSGTSEGPWHVFTAYVAWATGPAPTVVVERLTHEPIHVAPICQGGTLCQATSMQGDPAGDRRLGDFFETTIDPATGQLLGVWTNTAERPDDVVGHVQFVRQVGGLPLVVPADLGSFTPTQG